MIKASMFRKTKRIQPRDIIVELDDKPSKKVKTSELQLIPNK